MSKTWKIIIHIVIIAIVAGGGVYLWQRLDEQSTLALSIQQEPLGPSTVKLQDTYANGSGFSLNFPSSWGLVNITKHNLTDSDGPADRKITQYASYTFTSEFAPHTNYFTIVISDAKYKDDSLVTQGNRKYIAEDEKYYYNYNPSTDYCVQSKECKEDEVSGINQEIGQIIDSFKLLNP